MTTFQQEAAKTALKEMFKAGFLSISTIDKILAMTGGVPEGSDYDSLRLLHCVNFRDMSQSLRIEVQRAIERVLSSPSMTVEISFRQETQARRLAIDLPS